MSGAFGGCVLTVLIGSVASSTKEPRLTLPIHLKACATDCTGESKQLPGDVDPTPSQLRRRFIFDVLSNMSINAGGGNIQDVDNPRSLQIKDTKGPKAWLAITMPEFYETSGHRRFQTLYVPSPGHVVQDYYPIATCEYAQNAAPVAPRCVVK
jgi:hypothetical protein